MRPKLLIDDWQTSGRHWSFPSLPFLIAVLVVVLVVLL